MPRWQITTPKGVTVEVEADYITKSEEKIISAVIDHLVSEIRKTVLEDLINYFIENIELEFEFKSPDGRVTTAKGRLKRKR
ncbi:MAG: hypothetical protein ACXQS5_04690 [Candidatus Methanospirareceae archaeon]